jgi:hypothetical protein
LHEQPDIAPQLPLVASRASAVRATILACPRSLVFTLERQVISSLATPAAASAAGLLRAFPDIEADVRWVVAEGDIVVLFHGMRGTQQGPWLFVQEPTSRQVDTSFMLAFRFDDDGQVVDQWLGSNFVEMFVQLGWGFAPVGEVVPDRS